MTLKLRERIATWIAWRLPRDVAYWAYIRVATSGHKPGTSYSGNPGEQAVVEPMERWRP